MSLPGLSGRSKLGKPKSSIKSFRILEAQNRFLPQHLDRNVSPIDVIAMRFENVRSPLRDCFRSSTDFLEGSRHQL